MSFCCFFFVQRYYVKSSRDCKRLSAVARSPVMFSHSSSQALCAHPRDVPDDVLSLVAANGGVVMINFNAPFVAGDFWVKGGKVGAFGFVEVGGGSFEDRLLALATRLASGSVEHRGLDATEGEVERALLHE